MKITREDLLPHLAMCREVLDPRKAGILSDRQAESLGISLNKEGSVRRAWSDLNEKYIYIFKAFLDFYTDATNVSDDGGNPTHYVNNPIVGDATNGKIEVPGTYRNAFTIVRPMADDRYVLVQELRLGYIQSVVSGDSVDYSEARIEGDDQFHGDNVTYNDRKFITIVWKGVSPEASHSIAESLDNLDPDSDFSSVTVNGNVISGYRRLYVRAQEEADGSHSVRMMLGQSRLRYTLFNNYGTSNQGTDVVHFGVPSDLVQAIINSEQAVGKSARVSNPDNMGLHSITITTVNPTSESDVNTLIAKSCSELVYQSAYYGLSKTAADGVTIPSGVPAGTSYRLRKQARGDGFWTVILERIVTQYQETGEEPYISEDSAGRSVTRRTQLGVTDEEFEEIEREDGWTKQQTIRIRPDCSKDVDTVKIQSKVQEGEDTRGTIKYTADGTNTQNYVFGLEGADDPAYETPAQGITRTFVKTPNPDGSYNVVQRDEESPVLSSKETIATVNQTVIGTGTRNKRGDEPVAPDPAVGERVRHRVTENPDGTWDENLIIETAVDGLEAGGGAKSSCRTLGTDQSYRNITPEEKDAYLAAYDVGGASALVPGQRLVWSERENDDGTWDLTLRVEVAPDLTSTSKVIRKYGSITEEVTRNKAIGELRDPDAIVFEVGKTKTIRHDENPDCSYDETYREEVAPTLSADQRVVRKDVEVTVTREQNTEDYIDADALLDSEEVLDNDVVDVSNDENPDGTWNTAKRIERPLSQVSQYSINTWGGTVYTWVFRNHTDDEVQALIAEAQKVGITDAEYDGDTLVSWVEASNRTMSATPNQYGLLDGSIVVTPNLRSGGGSVPLRDRSVDWQMTIGETTFYIREKVDASKTECTDVVKLTVLPASVPGKVPTPGVRYLGNGLWKGVGVKTEAWGAET